MEGSLEIVWNSDRMYRNSDREYSSFMSQRFGTWFATGPTNPQMGKYSGHVPNQIKKQKNGHF